MISILISWFVIGLYAYLYGRTAIGLLYGKKEKALVTWDVYIIYMRNCDIGCICTGDSVDRRVRGCSWSWQFTFLACV